MPLALSAFQQAPRLCLCGLCKQALVVHGAEHYLDTIGVEGLSPSGRTGDAEILAANMFL